MRLIDFHNRDWECLLRGTNRFFNWKRLLSALRGFTSISERNFVKFNLITIGESLTIFKFSQKVTLSCKVRPSIRSLSLMLYVPTKPTEKSTYKVYAYIVKHNYIWGSMLCTICKAQLHVSATNIGHLQVVQWKLILLIVQRKLPFRTCVNVSNTGCSFRPDTSLPDYWNGFNKICWWVS
jgi:hypothetical protein